MSRKVIAISLVLASIVVVPMSMNHEQPAHASVTHKVATTQVVQGAPQTAPDDASYMQVFDTIGEDPEHAEARRITANYEIR